MAKKEAFSLIWESFYSRFIVQILSVNQIASFVNQGCQIFPKILGEGLMIPDAFAETENSPE